MTQPTKECQFEKIAPSGESHCFDTGYAIAYGVDEAIMIKNLQFFIKANRNRGINYHEGHYWTYDKLEDFPKHFPYWSVKQVRRIIASLIKQGVVITGCFNKTWSDRTQWYAFRDEEAFIGPDPRKKQEPKPQDPENEGSDDLPKQENEKCPNGNLACDQMGICNNDTSTITSAISSINTPLTPQGEAAKAAGGVKSSSFSSSQENKQKSLPANNFSSDDPNHTPPQKNGSRAKKTAKSRGSKVELTPEEAQALAEVYGKEAVLEMIEVVNDHCASSGKTYCDWPATIRNFFRNKVAREAKLSTYVQKPQQLRPDTEIPKTPGQPRFQGRVLYRPNASGGSKHGNSGVQNG